MKLYINYPLIWLLILSFTAYLYLIEDGSALGVCLLLPWLKKHDQKKSLSYLLPIWDLNQTWLVFSLAGLYGGFSYGFSLVMGQFYLAAILLVILFVCRGAAIEYASKDPKRQWLIALTAFSLLIAVLQGYIISELIISASNIPNDNSIQFIIQSFIGIITLVLYFILLGLAQFNLKIHHKHKIYLVQAFIASYLILIFMFLKLNYLQYNNEKHIISYFLSGLFLVVAVLRIIKKVNHFILLNIFAISNIILFEYRLMPNIFPNHTNYISVASSIYSLKVMIFFSLIALPVIFIMTRLIKAIFQNNNNYMHY